ncbi:hypothetical protein I4641_09445 [Waterburya agarophytonicola K14]|uniref:Uncharacterized protein n=1 Tax=Waterburya agarophytonicola KI4 TaxID=2874699 RepID=A0A964BSU5_9CYAN|nr:hypothetical protein [Waterburya agarophytonicola KI4]
MRSSAIYVADTRVTPFSNLLERCIQGTPEEQDRPMVVTGMVENSGSQGTTFSHILMLNILQPDRSWKFFLFGMNTGNSFDYRLINQFQKKSRKWLSLRFDKKWLRFNLIDDDIDVLEDFNRYRSSI